MTAARDRSSHIQVILQKRIPKPSLKLDAVVNIVNYGAKPKLKLQSIAVPYLQLSYSAYGRGKVFLPAADEKPLPLQVPNPITHPNGFEIPDGIRESTTFYLAAYNNAPYPGQEAQDAPIADANCTITVQHPTPEISNFKVTPAIWPFELGPVSVTLTWTVDWIESFGERSLTLDGRTLAADQNSYTVANVTGPQKWTLQATGNGGRSSQAEAEIKTQSAINYLYHPPRKYKGTAIVTRGTTVPIHTTVELNLSDLNHNTFNLTISYEGLDQAIRDKKEFAAQLERGMFVIPDSSGNPENTYHFRITQGGPHPGGPAHSRNLWYSSHIV